MYGGVNSGLRWRVVKNCRLNGVIHGSVVWSVVDYCIFLAALSSSRSLVVGPSIRRSVGPSVGRSVGHLCEKVTIRVLNGNLNLPTYLPMQQ